MAKAISVKVLRDGRALTLNAWWWFAVIELGILLYAASSLL